MHSQHNAGELLDRAEDIASLMPKARHLLKLRRAVLQLLPESLARSCTVANARQGRLVIYADSSAIAAKLKLLAPTLRNQLLEIGEQVTSVVVEVQSSAPPRCAVVHGQVMTPAAAAAIETLSERIPESELKSALRTLASRAKPRA